jgi:hypothetical protein
MHGFLVEFDAQSVCQYGKAVGHGGSDFGPQRRQIGAPFGEYSPDGLSAWMRRSG